MPIPTLITDLSTTAASNYPAGSDSPSVLDDVQRSHAAFIAQLRDNPTANATTATPLSKGGTGAVTAAAARAALQVAQYGGADQLATVGGTADALTLAFTPVWTALHGGIFQFVAASDNATTTPTGNPDGLGAKTFIKGNNLALAAGDIKNGMTMLARYDSVLGKLVLLNPATGVIGGSIADGSVTPVKLSQPMTLRTAVSLSGTSTDANSIPSWAQEITLTPVGTKISSTQYPMVQLKSGGTATTSGYVGQLSTSNGAVVTVIAPTIGFYLANLSSSADLIQGSMVLTRQGAGSNVWVASYVIGHSGRATFGAGYVTLPGALDGIRFTVSDGVSTYTAGSYGILYKGGL
jgi:hypothetical protein